MEDPAVEADLAARRVYIRPGSDFPGRRAAIQVRCGSVYTPTDTVLFDSIVTSVDRVEDCVVRLDVVDTEGAALHEGVMRADLAPGENPVQFIWTPGDLPPGLYSARISVSRGAANRLAAFELTVRILGSEQIEASLAEAETRTRQIRNHLGSLADQGHRPAYAEARVAVAEDAVQLAHEAYRGGDWPRADALAKYAVRTCDRVRSELTFGGFASDRYASLDLPDLARLIPKNGDFHVEDRRVFLIGAAGVDPKDLARLARYRLNFAAVQADPPQSSSAGSGQQRFLLECLREAEASNVGVVCCMTPPSSMPSSGSALPEAPWIMEAATVLKPDATRRAFTQEIAGALRGQPMLAGICLAFRPRYQFTGETARSGFIAHVREQFPRLDDVNRVWRSRLFGYEEIMLLHDVAQMGPVPNYSLHPPYRYDLQIFNQRLTLEYLAVLRDAVKRTAPDTPILIACDDSVFDIDEAAFGVDRESLSQTMDITGCATTFRAPGKGLALPYPLPSVYYALLQSFAPGKPVLDCDMQIQVSSDPYDQTRYALIYAALWNAVMSGADGLALHIGAGRGQTFDAGGGSPLLSFPDCLEAAAVAGLDFNRLADTISAFQTAPADVGILWSMPSKIMDGGAPYLASLLRAYEGASYFGLPVRFITERQCAEGELLDVNILIVPDMTNVSDETFAAVKTFVDNDGCIIRMGRTLTYDVRGVPRRDVLGYNKNTILIRGEGLARHYLGALDALWHTASFEPRPRIVNEYGYPIEGVVNRSISANDETYMYVLNVRADSVRVFLDEKTYPSGRDLIRDRPVVFPMELDPLDPMLIRIDSPAESSPAGRHAASGTSADPSAKALEAPTVAVGPAPEPEAPPPRSFKTPDRRRGIRPQYPPAERAPEWYLYNK